MFAIALLPDMSKLLMSGPTGKELKIGTNTSYRLKTAPGQGSTWLPVPENHVFLIGQVS